MCHGLHNTLKVHLPNIHEGAGKWIKGLEDETAGKLLSVENVKALLAKILGGGKLLT